MDTLDVPDAFDALRRAGGWLRRYPLALTLTGCAAAAWLAADALHECRHPAQRIVARVCLPASARPVRSFVQSVEIAPRSNRSPAVREASVEQEPPAAPEPEPPGIFTLDGR